MFGGFSAASPVPSPTRQPQQATAPANCSPLSTQQPLAMMRETAAETVPVSVGLGGFDPRFSARDLAGVLESVAGEVLQCRVKTSWTPPNSCPDFNVVVPDDAGKFYRDQAAHHPPCSKRRRRRCLADPDGSPAAAPPHAFVRFGHPEAARRAAAKSRFLLRGTNRSPRGAVVRDDTKPFLFTETSVELGNLRTPSDFVAAWRFSEDDDAVDFVLDPRDETCLLTFSRDTAFAFPGAPEESEVLRCDFRLKFSVLDIEEALLFRSDDAMLLRLNVAPRLYYRTAADDVHQSAAALDLVHHENDDGDPWIRTTDVTSTGAIGRCWVYKISFREWFWPEMKDVMAYLRERVPVVVCDDNGRRKLTVSDEPEFGPRMTQEPSFCFVRHGEGLEFPVWYLVNALLQNGRVNQHQLTPEFFSLLRREDGDVNVAALTEFLGEKFPVFDVCRRLKILQGRAATNHRLLRRCIRSSSSMLVGDHDVMVRSLVITPTRAYCQPPQLERSNRVIRHYHELADRFLRVTFKDEGMQPLKSNALYFHTAPIVSDMVPTNLFEQRTAVYRRVQRILTTGFHMCGRKYSFLAFSSNQLRNRSAWFFADDGVTTAASIREWMGQFPSKNVAKHAARMGLCFTSSYATMIMEPDEVDEFLDDVEHHGYNFSDGIGKITPGLAMEVAARLPLGAQNHPPSAYQIRYAGFKGVVAVWPGGNDGIRLSLRPSMKKFESTHPVLEVVSWTKFQPGFLNRQIITLLTSLGVSEEIFWQMQEEMIGNLDRILSDRYVAFEIATSCLAEHGNTLGLMLRAGFAPATEPHLKAMLLAVRASQLQGLVDKTKIFVPRSRWLMGCLDELGVLAQGQCFIRASSPSLDNCFVKPGSRLYSAKKRNAEVVVGTVVVAKNPCLHPGDVRVLEAVDVPELHHLVDCLVFPKRGERPHANEASGSDLDGDVYFVTWDEDLVPPGKKSWKPMDYSPAGAKLIQRDVRQHDIVDFFLKNMTSDNIGRISNAHVVHSDLSEDGAMDENCIHLAELAATAVDAHKTGLNVTMPAHLRPKEYPDFMGKADDISYESEKILGRLYRSVRSYIRRRRRFRSSDGAVASRNNNDDLPYFDSDLEVPGASDFFVEAWECKRCYDAQLDALLNQFGVSSEAELVTGEVWSVNENDRRRKKDTKERVKYAYSELWQRFRSAFESMEAACRCCEVSGERKAMVFEMKASAWYQVTYHPVWVRRSRVMEPEGGAKLSFAWIAVDYLARIKMRRRQMRSKS